MTHHAVRRVSYVTLMVAACLFAMLAPPHAAFAQLTNYENDADLANGLRVDYLAQEDDAGTSRSEAEAHYLRYVVASENGPQKASVYFRLGYMYTTGARKKLDEPRDPEKAKAYFELAIKADPQGICQPSLFSRTHLPGLTTDKSEKLDNYLKLYRYLSAITQDDIRKNIRKPAPTDGDDFHIRRTTNLVKSLVEGTIYNTVMLARSSRTPEEDLNRIINAVPSTPLADRARVELQSIQDQQR